MRRLARWIKRLNARRRNTDREKETGAPRSLAQRIRGWLYYGCFLVTAVAGIWIALEFVLMFAFLATSSESLATLESDPFFAIRLYPEYPADPQSYTKVAIFGGSAAAGDHSTRPFSAVIDYELKRRFPNRKTFVKNYARPGYPFHRHQAEYVKLLIDKYDVFIIYCGNNEAENWFDDTGYWRQPEYRDAKDLRFSRPVEARSRLISVLEKRSRIFALLTRAKGKVAEIEAPPTKNRSLNFPEFESADALPPDVRKAIVTDFERDMVEICKLAQARGKTILLAATATKELWPPFYSFFRGDIGQEEKNEWHETYQRGMAEVSEDKFDSALATFQAAREIDSGVAILNYRIGQCYLKLGDDETGRRYLRQAIDQDGFYSRSITPLHDKARELSDLYECLHYVDVVGAIHRALRRGMTDDEVFSDHCHMRLLGHVIVGRTFLDALLAVEPFRSWGPVTITDHGQVNWKSLHDEYHRVLGVSPADETMLAVSRINYFFNLSQCTAYPEFCYVQIDSQIRLFERMGNRSGESIAFAAISRARVATARGDLDSAATQLNQALRASPKTLDELLNWASWSHYIHDEFDDAGIRYDSASRAFVVRNKNGAQSNPDPASK